MTVSAIVRRVHGGELRGEELSVEDRRRCVGQLTLDGFSGAEIAELLGVGERTVFRDRAALRRKGAVGPRVKLGDEMLGEFERVVLASVQRLVRLTQEDRSPPYLKMWAEEAAVRNYQRLLETARRMGYVEDGRRRLREAREDDPEEAARARERMERRLREARKLVRGG